MFFKFKKLKGLTLTELLVVIGIVAFLSTMAIANYKDKGAKANVDAQAQKFASVLKQAQIMALTGEKVSGVRPFGYGIFINLDDYYYLFADLNGDNIRTAADADIQRFAFPTSVTNNSHTTYIIFYPPKAKIYVNPAGGAADTKTITFSYKNKIKNVVIRISTGRIDTQ